MRILFKPLIGPKLAFDKCCLRESVKVVERFRRDDYIGRAAGTTDEEIDAHVRRLSSTM